MAIALGSNLGDRRGHLAWAVDALTPHLTHLRLSPIVESAPAGVPDPQPDYLNAVVVGETTLESGALLTVLLDLERARGRERTTRLAARTLDLDLILYGDARLETDILTVPHPRFRERWFVLEPLAALEPDRVDPVTGRTIGALLADLEAAAPGARS